MISLKKHKPKWLILDDNEKRHIWTTKKKKIDFIFSLTAQKPLSILLSVNCRCPNCLKQKFNNTDKGSNSCHMEHFPGSERPQKEQLQQQLTRCYSFSMNQVPRSWVWKWSLNTSSPWVLLQDWYSSNPSVKTSPIHRI